MNSEFKNLPLRKGVGIVVLNKKNEVFVAKRIDNKNNFWQMPQGGVNKAENYFNAALRELDEETSIKNIEILKKCSVENLAYPLLLLSFLSRASEIIGKKLLISFDDYKFLLNFNVSISSNIWDKEMSMLAKKVEISFLDNKDNFSNQDWKNLYNLAEDTFVEETDSLKESAAGAGLTDND